MKTISIILLLLNLSFSAFAQTPITGNINIHVKAIIDALPDEGGDEYSAASGAQLTTWEGVLVDLFAGNYADAATDAATIGYDLIEFSENTNSETYYILQTTSGGSNYWGTYVYNPNACRSELIIMSPHPKKDFNTGKQGIYCFKLTDALFFMLAGTNRCNSTSLSPCSGTTTVCTGGASEAYRISDMAHVIDGVWQKTTEYLTDNVAGTWFAQLHGFTKKESDPYVIMSNGTQITPNPDKIVSLRDELLVVDGTLTFEIAHLNLAWTRLRGFGNTNGRYINGNTNANSCTTNAGATTGRFLHLEQEKSKLRQDSSGWHKMAMALGEAFNVGGCAAIIQLAVELGDFKAKVQNAAILVEWLTYSETNHAYFVLEKSVNGIDFQEIARLDGQGNSFETVHYAYEDEMPFNGLNYYRLQQVDFNGLAEYSSVVQVLFGEKSDDKVWLSNGRIEIEVLNDNQGAFKLYNQLGQLIFAKAIFSKKTQIAIPHLEDGIYYYQLNNGAIGKIFIH